MGIIGNEPRKEEEKKGEGRGIVGGGSTHQNEQQLQSSSQNISIISSMILAEQPTKMLVSRNASGGGEKAEMRELFLRMDPSIRVSRSVRAEWILDHLNCPIDLAAERSAKEKGLSLFGFVPGPAKLAKEERFRVGPNTGITFLADCYRIAFVLDLSPSSFVIDDFGCVLYTRLIQNLIKCLRSVVSKASIPGSQSEFRPRICVSICAFSPFLCFVEENILMHGILLSPETIDSIVSQLLDRLKMFIDKLIQFSQPHMREWSSERRRNRKNGSKREESDTQNSTIGIGTDRGFIQSDWALIFMLRMGLMAVQMMGQAGKSLANIVLVTDGVCGVLDQKALQGILSQLRLNSISCSFLQMPIGSLRGPVLGHVGFPELFNFIATATFGSFLLENDLDGPKGSDGLNPVQRALLTWNFRKGIAGGQMLMGKSPSPQMMESGGQHFRTNHVRNKCISRQYETLLGRLLAIRLREGFSIRQIDELQGSNKGWGGELLDEQQQSVNLMIRLSLCWRPQINIEYCICGPKPRIGQKKAKFHVDIFVEAQLHSPMANLLGEKQDPTSLRSALIGLQEGDTFLMHLNSFNSDLNYWELPKEVDRSVAIFEYKRAIQKLALAERYEALAKSRFISYWQPLSTIDEGLWQKWMHTHSIRLILAHDQPLPERIFTPQSKGRFVQCSAEMAFNELHNHLRKWATFALVKEQIYVCLIHEEPNENRAKKSSGIKAPDQFCLIRTSLDIPCIVIRLCFPPGVAAQTRDEVLAQFRESLGKLRIIRETQTFLLNGEEMAMGGQNRHFHSKTMEVPSIYLVQKPLERVLIRYREMPQKLDQIIRLKWTESMQEAAQMILHNAVSKFLDCKRQVWRIRGIFFKNVVPSLPSIEFILQTLLRLRLNQGFKLAWNKNGIVNLIRQVSPQKVNSDGQQPILEQCVIFGPTMGGENQINEKQALMMANTGAKQQRKSSLGEEEDKFGTLESAKCTQIGCIWPQIVTEIWSEPIKQQSGIEEHQNGIEMSRKALLDENGLLIRTFFTFDQMIAVCNSRLWAEKPFLLDQIGQQNEETVEMEDNSAVKFLNGAFDLTALLQNATQRELMLLSAMGYAENDPHSLTRLSFLLKGLQQELTEFCDFCMEFSDDEFFGSILAELEMCLGIQEHWRNDEMDLYDENDDNEGEMEEEEREQAIEAELEQLWRMNLPPEKEPPSERLTLPARPPPASSPPSPLPLGRHFSTGQHIYPYSYQQKEVANSIPNSPTPKNVMKTTFILQNLEREEDEEKSQSRNLFSESADSRGGMRKKKGQKQQQNVMIGEEKQQILSMISAANQRSTSVPLLWANEIKAKMGKMNNNNRPQQMMGHKRLEQKRASIGGQKTAKMFGELLAIEEPKKKLSAPSSSMINESNSICSPRDSGQQKCQQQKKMQKTLRIYAKRLNEWGIVIYVMAKDARVCRTLMSKTMPNTFPVMAFFCDKPKMAKHFVENMADGQLRPMEPWIVENFGIKSELSTLANLQRQIQKRENLGERRNGFGGDKRELDAFYLIGCFAAANARIIEMDLEELASQYLPQFDLVDHCENVFEEFLFTKAFIGTIYTCLGQHLFVPSNVLSEALDYRCEHTNIEIGPINEILKDTCSHLGGNTKEEDGHQQMILPSKRHHRHSSASSIYSSSSSSFSSSSSSSNISPSKRSLGFGVSSSMGGRSSGEDTLVMAETPIDAKSPFLGQNCANQLEDFRNAFEQLLRRHNFHRIPGLPDYFFYWPQNQQEHSLSSFNLPGLEDYIQITLPIEFSPPQSAHFSQIEPKMSAFSRHSSARNTGKERRTRKASVSAGSIAGGKKQNSTETMRRETEEQTEMGSIQSRCSGSSSTSWEQRDEEDEADSEKSSLAGELLSEHWPLFIQFYVSIQQQSSDQKENCPIEFIPNCLKQIFDRNSNLRRINLGERSKHFRLGQLKISIDMYILTWPLPSHCPFEEQQNQLGDEDSMGATVAEHSAGPLEEEKERGNVAELEELFGGSDGAEWIQKRAKGINQQQSGDEIFERKVEMLRQIPTEERRMLRRLQRNVQKMLKTEHILITSRAFALKQDIGTLLRVVQFIREEVDGRGAANARTGTEQTVARFEMCNKELVFVTESEDGLRRLASKLEGIQVEYCQLRQMPKDVGDCPFELESLMDSTKMLFYSCGVENMEGFVRTRHESIKQIGKTFKRNNRNEQKQRMEGEEEEEECGEEVINSGDGGGGLIEEEEEEEGEEERDEAFCNSSTTAEEGGTIAELTMPLNDLDEENILHPNDLTLRHIQEAIDVEKDDLIGNGGTSLVERKQLLHDFWLIIQIEAGGGDSLLAVNIYFCQRTFLLHDQLFENACRIVDEQIRLVNQELLLEKMHQTEECDQLLLDHDNRQIGGIGLDSVRQSNAATRSAQNVPGEALSRPSSKFAQNRPSSLLLEREQPPEAVKFRQMAAPIHARNNSLTFSDEDEHSEVSELARYKFRPGHFACQMVWHQWFPIHPRLKSCDIGFKALRLGLEGLAVRNRSNMYVYKEQDGNVVYMRLHCTEESVLANIPANGGPWEEEVRQHCPQCILLAVHGVRSPGEEITVQLRSVLQRRLNSRTLEEIQNALLKNAHIRLEWNDIRFIQKDPAKPFSIFFFTIPQIAQRHLGSVKYYLSQQMLTFCISPKFREQSGVHHNSHGRAKYSGGGNSSRYFSGGGTSLALSLAGTPTIEQQPPPSSQQFRIDSREMVPLHSFVPYAIPDIAQNPPNYLPTFYLVNKPPGEGKRDTGIACLEVKLIDWEGKLVEQTEEGRLDAESHSLLYPGVPSAIDTLQKMARLHELSRCIQVENPFECAQMPGICALFQFNMWQNGNVGVEELQARLKMCVQQAVCDLVTEFGLLSSTLFDNCPSPIRSKAGSFSVASSSLGVVQQQPNNKPCPSELPIPHSLIDAHSSNPPPIQSSPVKAFQQSLIKSDAIFHPQPLRHPVTVPLLNRTNQRPLQSPVQFANAPPPQPQQKVLFHQESTGELLRADFVIAADDWFSHVINETKGSPEMSHSVRKYQFRLDCDASAKKIIQIVHDRLKMVLKTERVVICRSTMNEATLTNRKRLQTIRSFTSLLEPTERDLGRKVANNGEEEQLEMALLAFNEQFDQRMAPIGIGTQQQQIDPVGMVPAAKIAEQTSPERGRLSNYYQNNKMVMDGNGPEVGRRATMMSQQQREKGERMDEEEEMRIWRNSMEPMQAFARRMSCVSSLGCWRSGAGANHHLMLRSTTPTQNDHPMAGGGGPPSPTATSSLSKFLPCLKPFIPRQRLLYLTIRGETINLFLYNYTNEVVSKTREIVERATLWHNARSRLLREIGLHKMGITHLSTLKSEDAKYNSYLLLTWMDPETLINNDYPVDSLTTPDFSNIPRIYAQLLLKLYRFADPAFVAKHISVNPFEDQTQQILALREDIRSMLNDHRLYMEVHQELIDKKELNMSEEMLNRLISHCHLVHFVQSPLLILPSWRRKVATIRAGIADFDIPCRKHSFQSIPANGKTKTNKNQFPIGPSNNNSSPHRCSSSIIGANSIEDEPCSSRIQQMLLEDYTNYLRSIGLCLLQIEKIPESSSHLFTPIAATRHPTGNGIPNVAPSHSQSPPEQWLYFALDGGIIFIHLSFIAPYFCIRVLQWNAQPQLDEHLRPSQQKRGSGTHLDQQHSLRVLENQKNELVRRCHLHSFVYDFHLRMVARYLVGEPHFVLFNPGYNTNAFLVDFLQYYGCRPPNARNCVYEETICCADLKSSQNSIWEYFLNNEKIFGWKVIRLKGQEGGGDEFMLVAKERRKAFGLDYELVRVIIKGGNIQQQKEHQITLKYYVLLVTEMMAPFESMSTKTTIIDYEKKAFAPDGGEFTQILVPNNGMGRGIGDTQIGENNSSQIELESFGEEEEEEEDDENEGNEAEECRVVDHDEGGTGTQSLFPSSIFGPIHHRQHSASSTTSQKPQPNNCYECVIAAELGENLQKGKSRKRFCSGGILLNGGGGGGLGRRNVAARMSLPPSRTSTNSSSTSSRLRQRSDSSQLSIGSLLMSSPTKRGEGGSTATKTLTPANSLKGLSEWRANQPKEEEEGIVDWSKLADVEMERKNLAIQRNPPRRHRKGGQSQGNSFCLAAAGMADGIGREKGAIVPPEQVTYLHYLSSHQRRLQHLLEDEVRTNQLAHFVKEADRFCFVDSLWKCLLTSRSFQIPSQKAQSLFLSSTSSKSDILSEATFFGRPSIPSTDLEHFDFEALLRVIGVESAVEKEPKLRELLDRVNWQKLCRFLVQFYEPERRCRFFECQPFSYLVITNPQFLDSAAMFRHNLSNDCVELFLLFKQSSHKFDAQSDSFSSNSVRKLFEEVISCLCAFQWSNLLQNPPNLM